MSADAPEVYAGLIDRLLALRSIPITPELLDDLENGRSQMVDTRYTTAALSPQWRAHKEAVDACIDLILPILRRVLALPASGNHAGSSCVLKVDVERLIGQLPPPARGTRYFFQEKT